HQPVAELLRRAEGVSPSLDVVRVDEILEPMEFQARRRRPTARLRDIGGDGHPTNLSPVMSYSQVTCRVSRARDVTCRAHNVGGTRLSGASPARGLPRRSPVPGGDVGEPVIGPKSGVMFAWRNTQRRSSCRLA